MKTLLFRCLAAFSLVPVTPLCVLAGPPAEPSEAEKLFALQVKPLLAKKCLACHGQGDELESSYDLRSRLTALRGGDAYGQEVIVPGSADQSILYAMVRRLEEAPAMPPKEAERLTEEETWAIRDWINGGAPWPDEHRLAEIYQKYAAGITWETSGGLSDAWTQRKYDPRNLWSYQPVRRPSVPADRQPVDFFMGVQFAERGVTPAPAADRRTLIRRATFDLLGLPPQPEEVRAFIEDPRTDEEAFAALVDRLLDSPHYGEQWGRHWLDVVRYADSSGFANDWERPNAWRYRDYVIRSFNDDKPYDQFVREQIAGDEILARMNEQDRVLEGSELLIAAGFLRMGPWEHTGMSVAKITRQLFLDDVTDAVGQVFLAHPLQCARCHDHKFDPIPTRDYYSMQAIFAHTQFAEIDAPWLSSEQLQGMQEDRRYHQMRLAANQALLSDVTRQKNEAERQWLAARGLPYKNAFEAKKANAPPEHVPPTSQLLSPEIFGQERIARKWDQRFPWELDRYLPIALTVYNGKTFHGPHSVRLLKPDDPAGRGEFEQTAILTGGDPFAPGQPVSPAVLSAVPSGRSFHVPRQPEGRRSALAEWLTDASNTLTARVMVNRIWQYHFGRGIAQNANNFGATGKKPTHPLLLDWLASEFVHRDWSIKHMHRIIMNSATYRRASSGATGQPLAGDYAVFWPRRLTAEELRDSMLAVSAELNRTLGGIPVRPDMNLEAALQPRMIMGTFAPSYVPNPKPAQRNRRSIYTLKLRGQRDPFMETFNQPGTDKSCERRDSSSVAPQALTLLNSNETADRALAFAHRVLRATDSDAVAVRRIFQLAYSRQPTNDELEETLAHWDHMTTIQQRVEYQPRDYPTEVERRAVEENTGEPFAFTERLFVYVDYVPDLQPHEADARTRGLADVCLAILNSNEFVYVY